MAYGIDMGTYTYPDSASWRIPVGFQIFFGCVVSLPVVFYASYPSPAPPHTPPHHPRCHTRFGCELTSNPQPLTSDHVRYLVPARVPSIATRSRRD